MNVIRLAWLSIGALFALPSGNSLLLVITIGSVEVPAYAYGVWRLVRTNVLWWTRELALIAVIGLGVGAGSLASYVGRIVLPHI
jgi:hypothetical protein